MSFVPGQMIRTRKGDTGQVVLVTRQTAYVQLDGEPTANTLKAYLISELQAIIPAPGLYQLEAELLQLGTALQEAEADALDAADSNASDTALEKLDRLRQRVKFLEAEIKRQKSRAPRTD